MSRYIFILLLLIFMGLQSCDNQLDFAPENVLIEDKVFEEANSAESAVAGMYYKVIEAFGSGEFQGNNGGMPYSFGDITTDLFVVEENDLSNKYITGLVSPDDISVKTTWERFYSAINLANIFIERVPEKALYADTLKKQHMGEALFVRALSYFQLLKLFGDGAIAGNMDGLGLPLQLTPYEGLDIDKYIPRNTNGEVFEQIKTDLTDALDLLPKKYESTVNGKLAYDIAKSSSRATVYSAYALLTRVALYLGEDSDVISYSNKVMSSHQYELSDLEEVFPIPYMGGYTKDNLFALDVFNNGGNWQYGANHINDYEYTDVNPDFVAEYPDGDVRKDHLLIDVKNQGYRTRKFYGLGGRNNVSIIRYTEVILNRAEALANGGLNQESVDLVNDVRERAGLSGDDLYELVDFSNKQELLDAIWLERKLEFIGEGHQRYDLLRTGRPLNTPDLAANKKVLPIPRDEIVISGGVLEQNEGYK